MATAIVALEGVLKTETGDPIPEGIKLYRILCEHYRIAISTDMSKQKAEHWLRSNLIIGYAEIYDDSNFFEGQGLEERHIDLAKAAGKVALYLSGDADHCAYALSSGIPSMMFASPKFVRTTRNVKPWEDLTVEVERQRQAILDSALGSRIKRFE